MMLQGLQWLFAILIFCLFDKMIPLISSSSDIAVDKFQVYWNVPTEVCRKYNISFDELETNYNIIQNKEDNFRGDKIVILYDPGSFPTLKNDYDKDLERNGGVPQRGNLSLHLEQFEQAVNHNIPDKQFSGIIVIDFEMWPPIYRQLWGKYEIYKSLSMEIEKNQHLSGTSKEISDRARVQFEKSARQFMEETLTFAKKLRPRAKWGYYNYPFCNNWSKYSNQHDHCPSSITSENDQMSWLYDKVDLLLPSVYLNSNLKDNQKVGLVVGRVNEAVRLANKRWDRQNVKILPYYWYRYRDKNSFIEKYFLNRTLYEIAINEGDGVIIWGKRDDLATEDECEALLNLVKQTLKPIIYNIKNSFINNY